MIPNAQKRVIQACLLAILLGASSVEGNEPTEDADNREQLVVVVRVSGQLMERLVNRSFDEESPFDMQVLDAWCSGIAHARGHTSLDFANNSLDHPIRIRVEGEIVSPATGILGPFAVTATNRMPFQVDMLLKFDGSQFSLIETVVVGEGRSEIGCVTPRRNRIGSKIVSRAATRFAPCLLPDYDAAGSRIARESIRDEANAAMEKLLVQVNQATKIDQALELILNQEGYARDLSKTESFLQVKFASTEQQGVAPPADTLSDDSAFEIWVYPNQSTSLLRELARVLQSVPPSISRILPDLPTPLKEFEEQAEVASDGQWDVIRVGLPPEWQTKH